MEDVVQVMKALCELFPGADQPLEYYDYDDIYVSSMHSEFIAYTN